jgi:hypothetical protein
LVLGLAAQHETYENTEAKLDGILSNQQGLAPVAVDGSRAVPTQFLHEAVDFFPIERR